MKFNFYSCEECDCRFAVDDSTDKYDPVCPNCATDDVVATGECIRDPNIEFDRD